jgi:hypothetical protein
MTTTLEDTPIILRFSHVPDPDDDDDHDDDGRDDVQLMMTSGGTGRWALMRAWTSLEASGANDLCQGGIRELSGY